MTKTLIIKQIHGNIFFLCLCILICGCAKQKIDGNIPLTDVGNNSASSIRMFNFSSTLEVTINNIPLTSYSQIGQGTKIGLAIFPSGIWNPADNGSPFLIPNSILDKQGKAHIKLSGYTTDQQTQETKPLLIDTIINNNPLHPLDYYVLANGKVRVIDRQITPANNTQNFKLRVINLGQTTDPLSLNGPVKLTYANGDPVPGLSNIQSGAVSDYIELPYGAYQFKLFVNGDKSKQLAELPAPPNYNPCNTGGELQEGIWPRVRTFKPGGVYSLVITSNGFSYNSCDGQNKISIYANSYRVLTERDPGNNDNYALMQAVNALPGRQISIKVDGQALGGNLSYIGNGAANVTVRPNYDIFIQGTHQIQAVDQNGTVLAEKSIKLFPADNYTIWAFEKPDGTPGLLFEANDMTATVYANTPTNYPAPDDGTNGSVRRIRFLYAWQSRFMNLCPDLPYATFTNGAELFLPVSSGQQDSVRYFSAYVNMASGLLPVRNTSVIYTIPYINQYFIGTVDLSEKDILPKQIRAYRSLPGPIPEIPGTLLTGIAPLDSKKVFVANSNLYTQGMLPTAETGIYTVALVGKLNQARLITIKHNK